MQTEELNRLLDADTFECALCREDTPHAGRHVWEEEEVCIGCYFWLTRQVWIGGDEMFIVEQPEDFYV